MKRLLGIIFMVLPLVLAGCANPMAGQILDGDGSIRTFDYTQIAQDEAERMMEQEEDYVIVDVRREDEYAEGHIPGAILIPNESIQEYEAPDELKDSDQIILVYCRTGQRSKEAAEKLARMGYSRVYEFGGIVDWEGEIEVSSQNSDAFALAAVINDNSDIDVPLLGVVTATDGGSSSGGGGTEAVPYSSYDGGVKAYAFPYPSDSESVYWTQIYIENDTNHILGIHNGDAASDIQAVMDEYEYTFKESTEHVYTSKDCDHKDTYNNGDVYFYFYMKGDTLVYYLVSVHD